jgi:hypothetical protein
MFVIRFIKFQNIAKYNDGVKYLLSMIDVFSKFLRIVSIKTNFVKVWRQHLIYFCDPLYKMLVLRQTNLLRTDRGKEFLNSAFQDELKREGIDFGILE